MNSLSLSIFLTGTFVPLLVIGLIWNSTGWNWKVRPIVPLWLGLFVLFAAFAADLYLYSGTVKIRKYLQHPPIEAITQSLSMLVDASDANDQLAKVLELMTIPLGVALVASALTSKSDLEFKRRISQYNGRIEFWRERRYRLDQLEEEFEESLAAGERGQALLDKWTRLKAGRSGVAELEATLRQQFGSLITEEFVEAPEQLDRDKSFR